MRGVDKMEDRATAAGILYRDYGWVPGKSRGDIDNRVQGADDQSSSERCGQCALGEQGEQRLSYLGMPWVVSHQTALVSPAPTTAVNSTPATTGSAQPGSRLPCSTRTLATKAP